MRYSLARDGEPMLAFDGEILGRVSTGRAGKHRWLELTLYELVSGYVVQTIARSLHPGERDWFSAARYDTAAQAIVGLRDRHGKMSKPALELLELAAEESEAICDALEAVEAETESI